MSVLHITRKIYLYGDLREQSGTTIFLLKDNNKETVSGYSLWKGTVAGSW
jgi:hypothetical protein